MALKYNELSDSLIKRIEKDRASHFNNPYKFSDKYVIRRNTEKDKAILWRPAFVRDCEKILHLPAYNRYSDKTQVFSFYNNDDLSRRALHVQLVSRIARNIGKALDLNTNLIEAIALGHDIGHTPFGHAGEKYLDTLLTDSTGCSFNHNVHSVRVLDKIYKRNISLQTLDGILCHNGEFEKRIYRTEPCGSFDEFDIKYNSCYQKRGSAVAGLIPCTLEGCVVRISDMIAYLGKDRQDARIAKIIDSSTKFTKTETGNENAEIINNFTVDIIENSYGKDHIEMSERAFADLKTLKTENYKKIYNNEVISQKYDTCILPMFEEMFDRLYHDVINGDENSFIFKHHIEHIKRHQSYYNGFDYMNENPHFIAADYIASMTDDYFLDLYYHMFPNSKYKINYISYFED